MSYLSTERLAMITLFHCLSSWLCLLAVPSPLVSCVHFQVFVLLRWFQPCTVRVFVDVQDEWSQSVVSDSFVHVQAEPEDEPSQSVVGAEGLESVAVAVFHSVCLFLVAVSSIGRTVVHDDGRRFGALVRCYFHSRLCLFRGSVLVM